MLTFDPTLTLGAILNAFVLLVGFVVAFTKLGGRIDILTIRLKAVETTLASIQHTSERTAVIETRQAAHTQMLAGLQQELQDMRRGRGFITDRSQGGINGEYP